MALTVQLFNTITNANPPITEAAGWTFMLCLKLARSTRGKAKPDTFVDLAAYAALLGESALSTARTVEHESNLSRQMSAP